MPDTDPTTPDAPTGGEAPAPAPDGTPPPPTKAPRRRRATSAAAAPAPAGAADPAGPADGSAQPAAEAAPEQTAPQEPTSGDGSHETDAPAPKKRAPRKRASKKAVEATGPEAAAEAGAGAAPSPGADPAPGAAAGAAPEPAEAPAAPAKRTRARKAPATVAFQAPVADAPAPVLAEEAAAEPASAAEAAPARRRRRAGTAGAVTPSALLPTLLEPVPATSAADEDDEDADGTDVADDALDALEGASDDEDGTDRPRRRRRRGGRGRGRRPEGAAGDDADDDADESGTPAAATAAGEGADDDEDADGSPDEGDGEDGEGAEGSGTRRRRRRRRRSGAGGEEGEDEPGTVVHVREPRARTRSRDGGGAADEDGVRGISGSTRMAAKRVRRQEGRDSGRRRQPILTEAEFLARRESVDRVMVVRQQGDRTQIAVLEDGILVEHYVTRASAQSYVGNVYLGRVQNVLPSMEAAFVDIGKGRNAVLYAGEVNWAGVGGGHRKIEAHLKSGQEVLVQVSKEPIGTKGARLTGQVSLPGRYLVYVPEGSMTGISRKLPEKERERLKAILKKVVPEGAGVIIRTAAEGASEEEIAADVRRLQAQWEVISTKAQQGGAPKLLHAEPDLVIRVIRDVFNEDFRKLVVQGDSEWETIREYVEFVAPDLADRLSRHTSEKDVFAEHRVDEQLAKALDRKVHLPSGGSLVIDRTEAMVVIDVNTGKYVGKGGNLEETVTRNNLEAAEEIARQLRLRDLGGIVVVDFIDMVLESNRDLVVRRLVECMARDRTKHQVAEVTSLGLVQMTRKRVGQGLLESFSEPCDRCGGRGVLVSTDPVDHVHGGGSSGEGERRGRGRGQRARDAEPKDAVAKDAQATGTTADGPADDAAEDGDRPARRGRRRSGRAAAAAAVTPADEVAELLAPQTTPEVAEQPTPAQEDQPVLPELASVADPEPEDAPAEEGTPSVAVVPDADDAPATEPTTAPDEAPAADPLVPDAPAPRRRRRATSRPVGPPTVL